MKRVLLVDDDGVFRDRLAVALTRRGYEVRTAGGADDALAVVADFAPAAAVLDLRMPGRNGLELAALLHERRPGLRIVMLTGYGSIATAMQSVRVGVAEYLMKPVDAAQIVAAIEGLGASAPAPASVPSLDRVEWEHLQRVLADCGGNISQAARALGIDRRSLQRKLAKYPPPR